LELNHQQARANRPRSSDPEVTQPVPACNAACCAGDRTTLRRAQLAEPVVNAAAFSTPHGAGVACLTHTGNLLVYSLPGLELLLVRFQASDPLKAYVAPF
jgi:hypothetical protein